MSHACLPTFQFWKSWHEVCLTGKLETLDYNVQSIRAMTSICPKPVGYLWLVGNYACEFPPWNLWPVRLLVTDSWHSLRTMSHGPPGIKIRTLGTNPTFSSLLVKTPLEISRLGYCPHRYLSSHPSDEVFTYIRVVFFLSTHSLTVESQSLSTDLPRFSEELGLLNSAN